MSILQLLIAAGDGAPPPSPSTWNPSNKGNSVVLSNFNLTSDIVDWFDWSLSTPAKSTSGKKYFEILVGTQTNNSWGICVVPSSQNPEFTGFGSWVRIAGNGTVSPAGVNGSAMVAGDVVGVAIDFTGSACQTNFYLNNVANGNTAGTSFSGNGLIGATQVSGTGQTHVFTIRTTAGEFSYSPPSGYSEWGG